MTSAKKRKSASTDQYDANRDSNADYLAMQVYQPPAKRRRAAKKKNKQAIRTPSKDLMATLPGETRNQIYEIVLVKDPTVKITTYRTKIHWGN